MVIKTYWARDDEYHLPFYRDLSGKMIDIHQSTGQRRLDPRNLDYADGLYWSRQWEYPWAVQQAEPTKGMMVLDVGCGLSPFLVYLGQIGCKAYGSDPGYGSGDGLCGYRKDFGVPYIVEIRKEPMSKLSWDDESFDRIFCLSVLEHVTSSVEVEQGVVEMRRILKRGGKLIITVDEIGVTLRKALLAVGVFTNGSRFMGYFDREYPVTRHPYGILGMILEK